MPSRQDGGGHRGLGPRRGPRRPGAGRRGGHRVRGGIEVVAAGDGWRAPTSGSDQLARSCWPPVDRPSVRSAVQAPTGLAPRRVDLCGVRRPAVHRASGGGDRGRRPGRWEATHSRNHGARVTFWQTPSSWSPNGPPAGESRRSPRAPNWSPSRARWRSRVSATSDRDGRSGSWPSPAVFNATGRSPAPSCLTGLALDEHGVIRSTTPCHLPGKLYAVGDVRAGAGGHVSAALDDGVRWHGGRGRH